MKRWAINWSEGMPLTPQHLQAADRHLARRSAEGVDWFQPYSYGVRKLELILRHGDVVLSECEARFKDGTTLAIPEDLRADELKAELTAALKVPGSRATIFLAIADSGTDRELTEWLSCDDENGEAVSTEIQFRRPKAVLMAVSGDGPPAGYRAIPLARVASHGPALKLLDDYVPPLLVHDATPTLPRWIANVADAVRSHVKRLAGQLAGRTLAINPAVPNDATRVLKLLTFNTIDGHLRALCAVSSLHPWWVYLELCRIAGQVATFRPTRMLHDLPPYNHDDLAGCFSTVIREIEAGLVDEEPLPYDLFPFRRLEPGPDVPLQVGLQMNWMTEERTIYLAVHCELTSDECLTLLRKADLTIADVRRVERYHLAKRYGLDLQLPKKPAPGLVARADLHYFEFREVDRVIVDAFKSGALAIKLNPAHFEPKGDQDVVSISGVRRFDFRFSLCVFHSTR